MIQTSPLYNELIYKRDREWMLKADIDGVEYGQNKIVDFVVERSIVPGDEFEIGATVISKLTLRLKTNSEIPPNAKIVLYLAMSTESMTWMDANIAWQDATFPWIGGHSEWMPLGEFYVDTRERVNNVWVYECYDKLVFANVPYISSLTYPTNMKAVWDEICTRLGYEYDESVQIKPYPITAGPAGYTYRQVMGYIASANAASVIVKKDGIVSFRRFDTSIEPTIEFTRSDYIRVAQTNPIKTYTRILLVYDTEENLFYEAGKGDEDHTLYVINPFGSQQMANDLLSKLNGFSYVPIEMDARGYPHLDAGDLISFDQLESMAWIDADIAWEDANFPWDGIESYKSIALHVAFGFKGGLNMTLDAPSKSEQQSEFQVEGEISQQVNKLNKETVRQGRNYYGVTITKEDGFTVERTDNLAKSIWNADEFTFWVEDEKAFWLDIPSRRLKFHGTLDGVDGIFSGRLEAATGTFSGDLSAAGGTFKGDLQAAGGTFSGDLSAAGGTFSGDLSAAGGTFTGTLQGVDGTFSGTITASTIMGGFIQGTSITGGTILGTEITGSTVKTAPDGFNRVELRSGYADIAMFSGNMNNFGVVNNGSFATLSFPQGGEVRANSGTLFFFGNIDFTFANVTGL